MTDRFRIAVNLLFLQPSRNGGCETYVRELLNEMSKDSSIRLVLLTNALNHHTFSHLDAVERVLCPVSGPNRFGRVIYEQFRMSNAALQHGCKVLFCPGYLSPVYPKMPTVVTIHDAQFRDLTHMPLLQKISYRAIIPFAARKAAAVLTVSNFSKHRLLNKFIGDESNIHVVLEAAKGFSELVAGSTAGSIFEKYKIRPPYLLYVASGFRHKNRAGLIEAFRLLKLRGMGMWQLVLVGQHTPEEVATLPPEIAFDVRYTGFVSDEILQFLYQNADAFAMPSYYEGFGMPVLEAMKYDVPVACSNTGSLPEIGGAAVALFDPYSPESIALALSKVMFNDETRRQLVAAGRLNLQRFSWKTCAAQTTDILKLCSFAAC